MFRANLSKPSRKPRYQYTNKNDKSTKESIKELVAYMRDVPRIFTLSNINRGFVLVLI